MNMIWLRLSQCFSGVVAIFNLFMALTNFTGSYWHSALSLVLGLTLVYLIIWQEWKIVKIRRVEREWEAATAERLVSATPLYWLPPSPQKQLDECWKFGFCPDCARQSLALFDKEEAMCSEVGCNSRFRRDQNTGKWSRIE